MDAVEYLNNILTKKQYFIVTFKNTTVYDCCFVTFGSHAWETLGVPQGDIREMFGKLTVYRKNTYLGF